MFEYILNFDRNVIEYERKGDWKRAAEHSYHQWRISPEDLNKLLCAGTELWYSRLKQDHYEHSPIKEYEMIFCNADQVETMLWDVTMYGERCFSQNASFNAYFGYMYQAMPYYFLGCGENINDWRQYGQDMMRRSQVLDPSNMFATAMAYEMDSLSILYHEACGRLWEQITPEQWGVSAVQKYFFRILHGESFTKRQ